MHEIEKQWWKNPTQKKIRAIDSYNPGLKTSWGDMSMIHCMCLYIFAFLQWSISCYMCMHAHCIYEQPSQLRWTLLAVMCLLVRWRGRSTNRRWFPTAKACRSWWSQLASWNAWAILRRTSDLEFWFFFDRVEPSQIGSKYFNMAVGLGGLCAMQLASKYKSVLLVSSWSLDIKYINP